MPPATDHVPRGAWTSIPVKNGFGAAKMIFLRPHFDGSTRITGGLDQDRAKCFFPSRSSGFFFHTLRVDIDSCRWNF